MMIACEIYLLDFSLYQLLLESGHAHLILITIQKGLLPCLEIIKNYGSMNHACQARDQSRVF